MSQNKCVWFVVGEKRLVAGGGGRYKGPEFMPDSLIKRNSRCRVQLFVVWGVLGEQHRLRSIGAP